MRRYHSTEIIKDSKSNDQVYKITYMPEIPKSASDRYIISREGDRLDLLANQFYKEPRMWVVLAIANNLGKGSFAIPPGKQIRLPDINAEEFELLIKETKENR
jgi:phage tail protein X